MGHLQVYLIVLFESLSQFVFIILGQKELTHLENLLRVSLNIDFAELAEAMRLFKLLFRRSLQLVSLISSVVDTHLSCNHTTDASKGLVINSKAGKKVPSISPNLLE